MTGPITLRPVAEAELPALAELLSQLDGTGPLSPESLQSAWRAMGGYPDYRCDFALSGGEVVGSLCMIVFPLLSHGQASEAIVESVVVHPAQRRKGYGRAMMSAAIALAASKGAYKLALSGNLWRRDAHRFYAESGLTGHGYSFSIATGDAG